MLLSFILHLPSCNSGAAFISGQSSPKPCCSIPAILAMLAILAISQPPPPPAPPASTQFHPRSPNTPKDRQRVAAPKRQNPASQPGSKIKNLLVDRRRPRLRP